MEQRNNQAGGPNHRHWLSCQKRLDYLASAESCVARRPRARPQFVTGSMIVRPSEHEVDAQLFRRRVKMRRRMRDTVLALVAALAFSPLLLAQTAEQSGAGMTQAAAPTPDLSGLWIRLRDPAHSSVNLDFAKMVSPMTPWAEAKFKAANSVYRGSSPEDVLKDPIFS